MSFDNNEFVAICKNLENRTVFPSRDGEAEADYFRMVKLYLT